MSGTIFACKACKAAYFFPSPPETNTSCTLCGKNEFENLEEWTELDCGQCQMRSDVKTQQMHGKLKRIKVGLLHCKYCNQPYRKI